MYVYIKKSDLTRKKHAAQANININCLKGSYIYFLYQYPSIHFNFNN